MRQFVLPLDWAGQPECRVAGREARHLVRVLRLGEGDRFPGIDSRGARHECEILEVATGSVLLAVGAATAQEEAVLADFRGGGRGKGGKVEAGVADAAPSDQPPVSRMRGETRPRIILAAAMLKGEKYDLVVRQATEAGVSRIMPIATTRSLGAVSGAARRERQTRIIREALQQSGSAVPTEIDVPVALRDLPGRIGNLGGKRIGIVLHETPLVEASLHRYLGDRPEEIVLCIGPEGGFSPDEIEFLRNAGFLPLRLPGAVLRAETATLFAIAAVEIVLSERATWKPALA